MMEKIDVFGITPRLYFQGKELYQTKCGSILTVLTGVSIILAFLFYGTEMFVKENPQTVFSEEFVRSPERYTFKNHTNSIAIGLQNFKYGGKGHGHFFDESIYSFQFRKVKKVQIFNETTQKKETITEKEIIKTRRCQESDFQVQGTQEAFKKLPFLDLLWCIDDYNAQDIEIEGDYGEEVFSSVELIAQECKNSKESNITCKDQNTIDNYLGSAYWAVYFTDQIITPKNYTTPFQHIDRDIFSTCSNKQRNIYTIYYKNAYMESNTGVIWSNSEEKRGLVLSYETENTYSTPSKKGQFLKVLMRFQKFKQDRIYRNYTNLATVLAQVGGISKMILMIFWVFSYFFVQRDYHIQLLNKLYNFIPGEDPVEKKTIKLKPTKSQHNISMQMSSHKNIPESQKEKLLDYFHNMFVTLNTNAVKSYFHRCLGKNVKQNQKLLLLAKKKLFKNLDVVRILTKLQEVDKLKELLLNQEQKQLFEYLPKPKIVENKRALSKKKLSVINLYGDEQSEFDKIQGAFDAYKTIQNKRSKSNIDHKIISLLDENVYQYFDKVFKNSKGSPMQIKEEKLEISIESPIKQKRYQLEEKEISVPKNLQQKQKQKQKDNSTEDSPKPIQQESNQNFSLQWIKPSENNLSNPQFIDQVSQQIQSIQQNYHELQETLSNIQEQNSVLKDRLFKIEKLNQNNNDIDQKITETPRYQVHMYEQSEEEGDNHYTISHRYGKSFSNSKKLNNIPSLQNSFVGQTFQGDENSMIHFDT